MFEKEIKFIIDFTINRIKKLGSFFTFEKLASIEIHPAIILYISNKLDYLIYEDRKKLLQNSSFDYSGSEISKYFSLIGEEIKKNKRLALEDIKTLVSHAVTFNINFLVTPNNTLTRLIFDENKTRNVNEIKMMLNYLYYFDYVRNVFLGYFSKRKILSLNETEFGLILNKIDKQMFSSHTRDLIDNALISIGDFFNEGGVNKTRISTQTIEMFLKEKNLMEALFKLRKSFSAEDKGKYDIEEIRKILYSKAPAKTQPGTKEEETEVELLHSKVEPKDVSVEEAEHDDVAEELNEEKDEIIIGGENFKSGPKELTDEENNIKEKTTSESPDDFLSRYEMELKSLEQLEAQLNDLQEEELLTDDIEDSKNEKVIDEPDNEEALTFEEIMASENETDDINNFDDAKLSDELIIEEEEIDLSSENIKKPSVETYPDNKKSDILNFLSDKDVDKIVSSVFNEDEDDFVNTLEKIAETLTYDEATEILKAVFFSYKVSPYSKEAVTLTNAVSNFFHQD